MENGERPSSREEAGWPPFPVEPRRDWHEMVVEEEREGSSRGDAPASGGRSDAPCREASRRRGGERSAPRRSQRGEREREAEEMRQRAADAAMRRAERLAAGGDVYEVVEVDATGEQSLADSASGLASDDANERQAARRERPRARRSTRPVRRDAGASGGVGRWPASADRRATP